MCLEWLGPGFSRRRRPHRWHQKKNEPPWSCSAGTRVLLSPCLKCPARGTQARASYQQQDGYRVRPGSRLTKPIVRTCQINVPRPQGFDDAIKSPLHTKLHPWGGSYLSNFPTSPTPNAYLGRWGTPLIGA